MKQNKIFTVLLILCTILVFTACAHDPKELAWEGYTNTSFIELLSEYYDYPSVDKNIYVIEGWSTNELVDSPDCNLDEDTANEPYTYVVELSDIHKSKVYHFYMDVDDDLLVVKGYADDIGIPKKEGFASQREAKEILERMID